MLHRYDSVRAQRSVRYLVFEEDDPVVRKPISLGVVVGASFNAEAPRPGN